MIKHWAKADTGMLIATFLLVGLVVLFFAVISNLFFSPVVIISSLIVVMLTMEYAAHELRNK